MTEEQKKALDLFADKAKEKGVHLFPCLWAWGAVLDSCDWRATFEDIMCLLDECKDGDEFERRVLDDYGQEVEPGFAEDDE